MADFFDKKTEDLGWTQMSALLDRDMPVEKRRRRPILWWTLASLALLGSGLFFYQKLNQKTPQKSAIAQVQPPITEHVAPSDDPFLANKTEANASKNKALTNERATPKTLSFVDKKSDSKSLQNIDNQQIIIKKPAQEPNRQLSEKTIAQPSKPTLLPISDTKTPPQYATDFSTEKSVLRPEKDVQPEKLITPVASVVPQTAVESSDASQNTPSVKTADNQSIREEKTALLPTQNVVENAALPNESSSKENKQTGKNESIAATQTNTTAEQSNRSHALLPYLPFGKIKPLEIPLQTVAIAEKTAFLPKIKPQNAAKWHWGITIGVHTEGGKKINENFVSADRNLGQAFSVDTAKGLQGASNGFQIGFTVQRDISRRWKAQSGLNYRYMTLGYQQFGYWQVSQDAFDAAFKNSGTGTAPSINSVKSDYLHLTKLSYLEMPLQVQYRFAGKWSVSLGAKLSYLIAAQSVLISQNATTYVVPPNNLTFQTQADRFDLRARTTIGDLQVRRWDVSAMGGVHFSPRRWDFSLRYDLGTFNVLKYQRSRNFNRYLGLNVAYFF